MEDDRKEGWLMTAKEARRMTAMGRGGGGVRVTTRRDVGRLFLVWYLSFKFCTYLLFEFRPLF